MMRWLKIYAVAVLVIASCVYGFERKAFQLKEDFGAAVDDCFLQYYYFIPCPTSTWFWGFFDGSAGDKVGVFFTIGDASTGAFATCKPDTCQTIYGFRVLDFAGYGQQYPGLFTVKFNIYCCDENGCPIGEPLWDSGPIETLGAPNWTIVDVSPPIPVTSCSVQPSPPSSPRILVVSTQIGSDNTYPQWAADNISTAIDSSCAMHDVGCLPALYPRPSSSHYSTMHSGYYGIDFAFCPPVWFPELDTLTYGYVELAWRLFVRCEGPQDATEPTTWGKIKSIYK